MNKSDHNKPQSGYDEMAAEMLRGFKVLDADGQNSGIAGHLTARIGDTDQLLGHQYGLSFDEVGLEDIRLAGFDLAEAKQKLVSPSLAFHVALYQARPDIGAIVHTHPDQVIAFSATGSRFNPVFQSALMLYRKVQHYDDYDGIVESNALGQKFARHLGDGQILLLKNHGLISVGKTIADAICAAVIFTKIAEFNSPPWYLVASQDLMRMNRSMRPCNKQPIFWQVSKSSRCGLNNW